MPTDDHDDYDDELPDADIDYRSRIAVRPGDPPIAYRPGRFLIAEESYDSPRRSEVFGDRDYDVDRMFVTVGDDGAPTDEAPPFGQWYVIRSVADPVSVVDALRARGLRASLDVVYFANDSDCCGCPPHPALAAEMAANPWMANPWMANPWMANPWMANPWMANPWMANAESLNLLATGKAPMSSVMPAPLGAVPLRTHHQGGDPANDVVIGVLDSGLAGGRDNDDDYRPELLGLDQAALQRISGQKDVPSRPINGEPADNYLDPVAGHGTFIAGIIEQLTPGCTIRVRRVVHPQGDVDALTLCLALWELLESIQPHLVNFSFGGTGRVELLETIIDHYHDHHDVVFVGAAGNEGSCVEQYPAALPKVVGVAALGPTGPARWSNYGPWVDACAPGTDLVSSFFARFDGDLPPINGVDADNFDQWATWSGTSFAAPVVVAALAREMVDGCTAPQAVERIIRAPHLARLPYMGTVVNF